MCVCIYSECNSYIVSDSRRILSFTTKRINLEKRFGLRFDVCIEFASRASHGPNDASMCRESAYDCERWVKVSPIGRFGMDGYEGEEERCDQPSFDSESAEDNPSLGKVSMIGRLHGANTIEPSFFRRLN